MQPTLARDDMNYWRIEPAARLRLWIQCYWMVEPTPGERQCLPPDGSSEVLMPDGYSELVFRIAGGFTRWHVDEPAKRQRMSASYFIGGRSRSVITRTTGGLRLAGVKLDPRAARALLRRPLTEFRDVTVACADLGCTALTDLEDTVRHARTPDRLAQVLDRFFLRRLADEMPADATVQSTVQRIRATRGNLSILRWARAERLDTRTLERRFIAAMGMTPKQYARILRFKHAYRRLLRRPLDKAHLDGYYDESHFHRDFRHFLATTPMQRRQEAAGLRTTIADHLLDGDVA